MLELDEFAVKPFHGFSKPQNKFIRDMFYGTQATGDTVLMDIARAVDSGLSPKTRRGLSPNAR